MNKSLSEILDSDHVKIYLENIGCERRGLDAAELHAALNQSDRYDIVNTPQKAQLIVFFTCGLSRIQKENSLKKIRALHKECPVIISGCLGAIDAQSVEPFSALIYPPTKKKLLYQDLNLKRVGIRPIGQLLENDNNLKVYKNKDKVWLSVISEGCLGNCTYCAIKKAIGPLNSKPVDQILASIEEGVRQGYQKIQIEAEDSGAYGIDIGTNFVFLIESILREFKNIEISMIKDLSPKWIIRDKTGYASCLTNQRIKHVLIPIQSGSPAVLKRMNRKYSIEKLQDFLNKVDIKDKIWTHVIVGFPGETWKDFFLTVRVIKRISPKMVDIFPYQENPGTVSEKIFPKVNDLTVTLRRKILKKLFSSIIGSVKHYVP